MKTSIIFNDAHGNKALINIEIKDGCLSMSGDYAGGCGQIVDHITPNTDAQQQLIDIWNTYHLNDMKAGTPKQTEAVKDSKSYEESKTILSTIHRETGLAMRDVRNTIKFQEENADRIRKEIEGLNNWRETDPTAKIYEEEAKRDGEPTYCETKLKEYTDELTARESQTNKYKDELKTSLLYDMNNGELYEYGSRWLRLELPTDIEEQISNILQTIEEEEQERRGAEQVEDTDLEKVRAVLTELGYTDEEEQDKIIALAINESLTLNDLEDISGAGTRYTHAGMDYLICTDEEADEAQDQEFEQYLEDCILPELPEKAQRYFDREAWKADAQHDGRGHSLNRYDGTEDSQEVNKTYYYIYRN